MENNRMFRAHQFLHTFLSDETGGEVMEYAIVAGLISIAAIAVIGSFGVKVLARWNSVNSSM
jgi:Flp pilus assembly pilin Flp